MPRCRQGPLPHPVAANPEASRLLSNLISSGVVQPGDTAKKWRLHPNYKNIFQHIDPEKFRKRFVKLMKERDSPDDHEIHSNENLLGRQNTEGVAENDFICGDEDAEGDTKVRTASMAKNTLSASSDRTPTLSCKPLYVMAKWKHPVTRDGRIALTVLLPTGVLENDDGVRAAVVNRQTIRLTFAWPRVLPDSTKLMGAVLSFCSDMDISHGTLLAQGLMEYLESFQAKQGEEIKSTCDIPLPFEVKPDFTEDVLSFENSDVRLHLLRLSAPERNFVTQTSRFRVHTIRENSAQSISQRSQGKIFTTSCTDSSTR